MDAGGKEKVSDKLWVPLVFPLKQSKLRGGGRGVKDAGCSRVPWSSPEGDVHSGGAVWLEMKWSYWVVQWWNINQQLCQNTQKPSSSFSVMKICFFSHSMLCECKLNLMALKCCLDKFSNLDQSVSSAKDKVFCCGKSWANNTESPASENILSQCTCPTEMNGKAAFFFLHTELMSAWKLKMSQRF